MGKHLLEILNKWIKNINEFNIDELLSLYDADAVIIPTFSDMILNSPDKRRNYFESLAQQNALEVTLHEKTVNTQFFENGNSIIYGIYSWKYMVENELMNFEARFSFVIDHWKTSPIIHHHSSAIPRVIQVRN